MRAELRGDAVEVVIRPFVAVQATGLIFLGVVEFPHPGAFDGLKGFGDDLRKILFGMFLLHEAIFKMEQGPLHLLLGRVARPAHADRFLEKFLVVGEEMIVHFRVLRMFCAVFEEFRHSRIIA